MDISQIEVGRRYWMRFSSISGEMKIGRVLAKSESTLVVQYQYGMVWEEDPSEVHSAIPDPPPRRTWRQWLFGG